MNSKKRSIAIICLSAMTASVLAGCSSSSLERVDSLPKQNYKLMQEIMDDGKEALNFSSFSQRTAVSDYKAQFNPTTDEDQQRCLDLLQKILVEHNMDLSQGGTLEYVSKENHDYLKAVLDDLKLSNPVAESLKEFSGYYFLTVSFDTAPNELGQFKNYANYVGLDNCIIHYTIDEDVYTDTIDPNWITQITGYLNAERDANNQIPLFVENTVTTPITPAPEETAPVEDTATPPADGAVTDGTTTDNITTDTTTTEGDTQTTTTDTAATTDTTTETEAKKTGYAGQAQDPESDTGDNGIYQAERAIGDLDVYSENLRHMLIDVDEYEDMFGGSATSVAYFPELAYVYQPVAGDSSSVLVGNGCYNEGTNGLREYGFDRAQNTGKMVITFVFAQDEVDKDNMTYVFPYIESYTSDYQFGSEQTVNVPEIADEQIRIKIEEYDRLVNNQDINGLMKQYTIEDAGLAFKSAEFGSSADINDFASKLINIVDRKENSYLVKVERTVAERPAGSEFVSQYKDTLYYVIRQKDLNFYINDMWLQSRELTKQPTIYEINPKYRQLVALNLSGEVTDAQKQEITVQVFDKYEEYANSRNLGTRGGLDGISSLFDTNTEILSDTDFDYMRGRIQTNMIRGGANTPSTLTIVPVEWIGGFDTQVELTTKELIEYEGVDLGLYLENYYVVSHFGNQWVIDDIQQITERELSGEDLAKVKEGFTSGGNVELPAETAAETTAE